MKTSHKRSAGIPAAAFFAILLVLAGCSSDSKDVANQSSGGTLRIARNGDPSSLDRTNATDNPALWTMQQIVEPLVKVGSDGRELVPWLAESYESSEDLTTWRFVLRSGVTFSNGAPLTAEDVKYSIEQTSARDAWGWINDPIKEINAVSENEIVIRTKYPSASLPSILALVSNGIVPADLGGMSPKEFGNAPIGTGPYVLESWEKGQSIQLKRNSDYWNGGGGPDELVYTVVPDESTRILQLEGGQVDVVEEPSPSRIPSLEEKGYEFPEAPAVGVFSILLNTRNAPFDDVKVRQAMNHAINRAVIVESLLHGLGEPAASFLPPAVKYHTTFEDLYSYDIGKAETLMAESSHPDGFKAVITLGAAGGALEQSVATVVQEQLAAIGINLSIQSVDQGTAFELMETAEFEMATISSTTDITDPSELSTFYVDPAGEVDQYFTGWLNESVAEANQAASSSADDAERTRLYAEIQEGVATDVPWLPLFTRPIVYAMAPYVSEFSVRADGYVPVTEVSLNR